MSGDILGNDTKTGTGKNIVFNNMTDNVYHVVLSVELYGNPILDGFTITGGNTYNRPTENVAGFNNISISNLSGSGVLAFKSGATLNNCIIEYNISGTNAGINIRSDRGFKLTNSIIRNNYSYGYGSGISLSGTHGATLENNEITDNYSLGSTATGGGLEVINSSAIIRNNIIKNNYAGLNGAGVYLNSYDESIFINNLIINNLAEKNGGGIFATYNAKTTFLNNTISNNNAPNGSGLYVHDGSIIQMQNTIIWDGVKLDKANPVNSNTNIIYKNSLVKDSRNASGGWINTLGTNGLNNKDFNPNFKGVNNYELSFNSPAINMGSDTLYTKLSNYDTDVDLINSKRRTGSRIDMGAYESKNITFTPDAKGILYVRKDGLGNGSSWTDAMDDFADALLFSKINNANAESPKVKEIWVSKGTYYPRYSPEDGVNFGTNQGRYNTFLLEKDVKIYGGFAGIESNINSRNLSINKTILSGDLKENDIISGVGKTLAIELPTYVDNSLHVVLSSGDIGTAELDGFHIYSGTSYSGNNIWVNERAFYSGFGAGIYFRRSSPKLTNLVVSRHTSDNNGVGAYFQDCSPIISNSIFSRNISHYRGGAIHSKNSSPTIINTLFAGNHAGSGAGISFENTEVNLPIIINSTFAFNYSRTSGAAIENDNTNPKIYNSIIWENVNNDGTTNYILNKNNSQPEFFTSILQNSINNSTWNPMTISGHSTSKNIDKGNNSNANPKFLYTNPSNEEQLKAILTDLSPAIDKGNNSYFTGLNENTKDLAYNPRVVDFAYNGKIDIGAYEYEKVNQEISELNNLTKTYGDADFTLTATTSSNLPLTYSSSDPTIATISDAGLIKIIKAGTVSIKVSQVGNVSYKYAEETFELEIKKAMLTITAENKNMVSGAALPELTYIITGFKNNETKSILTTLPTINTTASPESPAGKYPINLSDAEADNYEFTYVNGELTISPKPILTITIKNAQKQYGALNPTFEYTTSGWLNEHTQAKNLSTIPTLTTLATQYSSVGTYTISGDLAVAPGYDIIYITGELTIDKIPLTITADAKNRKYGDNNPTLTFTYDGLIGSDTKISIEPNISTSAIATSPVNVDGDLDGSIDGKYPITLANGSDDNYTITLVNNYLTIEKALLEVIAENKAMVTGSSIPELTYIVNGFKNEENINILNPKPTLSLPNVNYSIPNNYTIEISGASADNYDFNYVSGILKISGLPVLTITIENKNKIYGADNPELKFSTSGWLEGHSQENNLDEDLITLNTTATKFSAVGSYPITGNNVVIDGYNIVYISGILSIDKVTLTITAANKTKLYGDDNPELTLIYSGLVANDTKINVEPTISTSVDNTSTVGNYPINITGGSDNNYTINFKVGTFTVEKATLVITADDKTINYGDEIPAFTASYAGFKNNEDYTVLTKKPTINSIATTNSIPNKYPIEVGGAEDENYYFNYIDGELTIQNKILTITVNNDTKIYGQDNPNFTYTTSGWKNGHNEVNNLTIKPTFITSATTSSPVDTYDIIASGASVSGYDIVYKNGSLVVNKATVTITPVAKTKIYGDINPTLTFTYNGLVGTDTKINIEPSITTEASIFSEVGTYPISLNGGSDKNYILNFGANNLIIQKGTLNISVDSKTIIHGDPLPNLTYNISGFRNGENESVLTKLPIISTTAVYNSPLGNYQITASNAEAVNYTFNYQLALLSIVKKSQTITFQPIPDKLINDPIFNLIASSNSELPIVFTSSDPAIAQIINGNQVKILRTGMVSITASQNGDQTYAAAQPITHSFTIVNNIVLNIIITSNKGNVVNNGDIVELTANGAQNYQWSPDTSILGTLTNSVLNIKPTKNTTYTVTGTDNFGNVQTISFTITVKSLITLEKINNIISPNGDGVNDNWIIVGIENYQNNKVKIYDRSGIIVFESQNYNNNWDGRFNGKLLAEGSYLYLIDLGDGITLNGMVTLIH